MAERKLTDEWLAAKLKAEADRYEPDLAHIRERIQEHRSDRPARRSTWLLPAAAATFVVLAAGTITAVYDRQSPTDQVEVVGPADSPTSQPSPTSSPSGTGASTRPPVTSSGPSAPSRSATAPASADPGSAAPSSPVTTRTAAASQNASRPSLKVQLVPAGSGTAVTLPGNATDWVAAGSGSAGQTIRRANGEQTISGPHETGDQVSVTNNGPFSVSWTGGMAQASQNDSRIWRTVSGPPAGPETGLILRVPAEKRTRTFVLYIGAEDAPGELRTRLGAQSRVTRLKADGNGGYVATVSFRSDRAGEELTVELIGGSGGSISFAAAALR